MTEPAGFETWNRAIRGAFKKGYKAAQEGREPHECPYQDKRMRTGNLTWSRMFRNAWRDGWQHFHREKGAE